MFTSQERQQAHRFADYFFDGLIADWTVQSKISNVLSQAQDVLSRVQGLLASLRRELKRFPAHESELQAERRDVIESA